jgi:hypothetical protein
MSAAAADQAAIIAELRSGVFPVCHCGEDDPHHRHGGDPREDEAALTSLARQGINELCEAMELVPNYACLPGEVGLDVLNGVIERATDASVSAGGGVDLDYLVRRGDRVFLLTHQRGDKYDWHEFRRCDDGDELARALSVYFGCRRPAEAVEMLLSWHGRDVENIGESGEPGQPGWSRRWKLTIGGETAVIAERVEALGSGWEKVEAVAA